MSYFRISADGPHASTASEKIVGSASEAEMQVHLMRRLCGRSGSVTVWGKDGRQITPSRLAAFVRAESASADQAPGPAIAR